MAIIKLPPAALCVEQGKPRKSAKERGEGKAAPEFSIQLQ